MIYISLVVETLADLISPLLLKIIITRQISIAINNFWFKFRKPKCFLPTVNDPWTMYGWKVSILNVLAAQSATARAAKKQKKVFMFVERAVVTISSSQLHYRALFYNAKHIACHLNF